MFISNLFRGPLRAPEGEPTGGGAPPDPGPPVAPPVAPPTDPANITLTSEQLRDRLDRSKTSFLRAHGFASEDELKALKLRDVERVAKDEETRKATMTREQQLQEELAQERAGRAASDERAMRATFDRHVAGVCATLGVKNLEYATFLVEQAAQATPEGSELDVQAWLQARLESHPATRAALGMDAPVATVVDPITTVPGFTPPPPPRPGAAPPASDAFGMDAAAWQARRESLGIT
jgi:hypothetical protein